MSTLLVSTAANIDLTVGTGSRNAKWRLKKGVFVKVFRGGSRYGAGL